MGYHDEESIAMINTQSEQIFKLLLQVAGIISPSGHREHRKTKHEKIVKAGRHTHTHAHSYTHTHTNTHTNTHTRGHSHTHTHRQKDEKRR